MQQIRLKLNLYFKKLNLYLKFNNLKTIIGGEKMCLRFLFILLRWSSLFVVVGSLMYQLRDETALYLSVKLKQGIK